MILTCLFILIPFIGIILKRSRNEDAEIAGILMSVFGTAALITSLIAIIVVHATANHNIQKNKIEYEGLCKRYETIKSEYEDVSKSDVIADITAWNMEVYNTKYWSENLFTNWFNPKKIADNLEYIPLDEESEAEE